MQQSFRVYSCNICTLLTIGNLFSVEIRVTLESHVASRPWYPSCFCPPCSVCRRIDRSHCFVHQVHALLAFRLQKACMYPRAPVQNHSFSLQYDYRHPPHRSIIAPTRRARAQPRPHAVARLQVSMLVTHFTRLLTHARSVLPGLDGLPPVVADTVDPLTSWLESLDTAACATSYTSPVPGVRTGRRSARMWRIRTQRRSGGRGRCCSRRMCRAMAAAARAASVQRRTQCPRRAGSACSSKRWRSKTRGRRCCVFYIRCSCGGSHHILILEMSRAMRAPQGTTVQLECNLIKMDAVTHL